MSHADDITEFLMLLSRVWRHLRRTKPQCGFGYVLLKIAGAGLLGSLVHMGDSSVKSRMRELLGEL